MSDFESMFVTETHLAPFTSSTDIGDTLDLVNQLVGEEWKTPVSPVPAMIKALALDVAIRAIGNPKGVDSVTRSTDGTSMTDRYVSRADPTRRVYLTARERRILSGRKRRYGTVRTPSR